MSVLTCNFQTNLAYVRSIDLFKLKKKKKKGKVLVCESDF